MRRGAESQREIIFRILHRVTEFMRGDRHCRDRGNVGNGLRKIQNLRARIIIIGQLAANVLNLYAV